MSDYLALVAAHFGIEPKRVLVCRVEGNELVVVLDRGIQGCPKQRILISKLAKRARAPEKKVKP